MIDVVPQLPPFDAYLLAVVPWRAWPDFVDPQFTQGSVAGTPVPAAAFFGAVRDHFQFLETIGFAISPPDNWEAGSHWAIPFTRSDLSVVVAGASHTTLFVLVAPTPDEEPTARQIFKALPRAKGTTASFASYGSFPLLGADAATLDAVVASHARSFKEALGGLIAAPPVDMVALAHAAETAVESRARTVYGAHYRRRADAAWNEGRYGAVCDFYERLAEVDALMPDEQSRWLEARVQSGDRPIALRRSTETDQEWILRRAEHLTLAMATLNRAFARRDSGPDGLAAWEDAVRAAREAQELMYPENFWADVRRLQAGDPSAVESALVFLEADPWCFRSGYAKETLVHLLRRHDLSRDQRERLQTVFLYVVDIGDRREFGLYVKLARHNANRWLRDELSRHLHAEDPGVARRALWMLTGLRHPRLGPDEVVRAREIILLGAKRLDRPFWIMPEWVHRLTGRFWSDQWGRELVGTALGHGEDADQALRVLVGAPHVELEVGARQRLADLLLQVVDAGGDESWFESLAVMIDTPELRDLLEQRRQHPDEDIRRRAWWAINAIRRASERRTDP